MIELFKAKGALLEGHFVLSSGLHSNRYFQSALLLQDPETAGELGQAIADKFSEKTDVVISPAMGGLIIGHEVARAKNIRFNFFERDKETDNFVMRRGFHLNAGENVLIIEDVITTGKSTNEVISLVESLGGNVIGAGCVVDRSNGAALFNLKSKTKKLESLLKLSVETWAIDACPMCKEGKIPPVKPGSRKK